MSIDHTGRRHRLARAATSGIQLEGLESRTLYSVAALPVVHAQPGRVTPAVATTVKAAASLGGTGITAQYFSDPGLTTTSMVRTDPSINFAGAGGYGASLKAAGSAQWTGQVAAPATGAYTFSVQANGGVKLWVNGTLLINSTGAARATQAITLTAGTKYAFQMQYTKGAGKAPSLKLLWAVAKGKQQVVPQTSLFPSDDPPAVAATSGGLIGQYYVGDNFQQLAMTRADPAINFNWGLNTPDASIPARSPYSVQWTGQFTPATGRTYTFTATADDGVRVYVGGQLVVDDYKLHSVETAGGQVVLNAGQSYDLKVQYFNSTKQGQIKLTYANGSGKPVALSGAALTSTPRASAGVLSVANTAADEVDLAWTGSAAATGYTVSQSADNGATWQAVGATPAGVTTFADAGLAANAAYEFKVTPFGSADTSTPSNVVAVTTLAPGPGTATATATSPTGAHLAWDDVPGETGFVVLESVDGGPFVAAAATPQGVTQYDVTGLLPGNAYQFQVAALNAAGRPSAPTTTAAAATTPTTAPAALVVTDVSAASVGLTWTDTLGEGGFVVERSTDGTGGWAAVGTVPANTTAFTDADLSPGTTYYYRVRGLASADTTVQSDPSPLAAVETVTAAPTGVSATAYSATRIDLAWADVTGEAGFTVLESTDGGTTFAPVGTTAAGGTTFSAQPLLPGTAYQFAVEAANNAGRLSAASTPVGATTPTLAPALLTALGVSDTTAQLTWTPVVSATGYQLERSADGGTTWSTVTATATGTITYTDTGLTGGASYSYRVRAVDAGGASDPSAVAVALTIPSVPSISVAGLNVSSSSISFPAVTGATSYTVQRSLDGATGWTNVATVGPTGTAIPTAVGTATPAVATPAVATPAPVSATVPNVAPSTIYYYRAMASNATGSSAPSAVVSQMTAPLAKYTMDNNLFGLAVGTSTIQALDTTAGTSTVIGQLMPGAYAANRSPADGCVYYAVGSATNTPQIWQWNPTTGNNTLLTTANFPAPLNRATFDLANNAWFTDAAGHLLEKSATSNAASPTVVATLNWAAVNLTASGAGNMAFSPQGQLYIANNGQLFTVNTTTGVLTPSLTVGVNNVNITFGQNGLIYGTDSQGHEYSVNLNTLVSTTLGTLTGSGGSNAPVFNSLTSAPRFADLGVTATATPTILQAGHAAAYTVNVSNNGPSQADGNSIFVTVALGAGLTFTSVGGTGWTATTSTTSLGATTIVLQYSGSVLPNGNAPTATLNVNVTSSAHATAVTTFAVNGDQFDTGILNNTATVTSTVA